MKDIEKRAVDNFYLKGEYFAKNRSLHEEDSPWKVSKIIPLIDAFMGYAGRQEINLLDAGGGSGLILKEISDYIEQSYRIKPGKFILDLSPGMLEAQKKNNPELKKILNENIQTTSLDNKEIDLTLMIDLLEHVSNPVEALKEVKRISRFAIFKVPLEDNLTMKMLNFMNRGRLRRDFIDIAGHVNIYNLNKLITQVEAYTGRVLDLYFTNVYDYFLNSGYYKSKMKTRNKILNSIAARMFKLSPRMCSFMFNDFVVMLVRCY